MATLIAYQNGNFTGATTWKQACAGTGAEQSSGNTNANTPVAYAYSNTFTVPNGDVIEGMLMLCNKLSTASGTITVALSDNNGVTATREVTINATDLPDSRSWVYFKFGSSLTGDGGTDYRVAVKASAGNAAAFFVVNATNNWNRILVTSTTATIATTDVVYISGERTGAGSVTNVTVTMDQTANTSYGAMNIGDAGTVSFGTSASTNYYLRLAGNLNVYGNGTLNIGTSGTRIPSTSTATLEFNCASNVQFGLWCHGGSTVNLYGAEKANTKVFLTSDANSGQAVLNVDSTTDWSIGDELAIAPTRRTVNEGERRFIQTINSGTQVTLTANLSNPHPTAVGYECEVMNLTRNVRVRGLSNTLRAYLRVQSGASFTSEYTEFYWMGDAAFGTTGMVFSSVGGTYKFCSIHDMFRAICSLVGATPIIVEDCVFSNNSAHIDSTSGTPPAGVQYVIKDNWGMSGVGYYSPSLAGTITGNRFFGGNNGFLTVTRGDSIGTFKDNVAHTCGTGLNLANLDNPGVIENFTAWRCTANGISSSATGVTFKGANLYHNVTNANLFTPTVFTDSVFDGGTGQSLAVTTTHIIDNGSQISFENCDFGQTNQATNLINASRASQYNLTFTNCDIAESLTPLNQSNILQLVPTSISAIKFDKLNSTSGNHRAYKQFGYAGSDQSVYRTASPSEVLVPNSASGKLPSGSKKFGVASGNDATVSVWVRKSSTYNGAEPRLILKRNIVGGVSSDQVLDTASGANETWLELTASTPTVTDDCVLEVYVDCDGTAGTVNCDDFSVS